jgi:DNA-binding response OmpR family regulator
MRSKIVHSIRHKILIIDDEPINIQLLKDYLKKDYSIQTSLNGFDAIHLVKEQRPDLILLDVIMPDINGFDVARIIKSNGIFSAIPIIFLTALDSSEAEAEGLEAGGIDFLTKPVHLNLMKLRIINHLALKHQTDLILEQRDLLIRQKEELESSIARIKRLEGLLPICMHCKSIRIYDASWQRVEEYIVDHSDASFTHGICPNCIAEHYPDDF